MEISLAPTAQRRFLQAGFGVECRAIRRRKEALMRDFQEILS
jgi:hypothetical protein